VIPSAVVAQIFKDLFGRDDRHDFFVPSTSTQTPQSNSLRNPRFLPPSSIFHKKPNSIQNCSQNTTFIQFKLPISVSRASNRSKILKMDKIKDKIQRLTGSKSSEPSTGTSLLLPSTPDLQHLLGVQITTIPRPPTKPPTPSPPNRRPDNPLSTKPSTEPSIQSQFHCPSPGEPMERSSMHGVRTSLPTPPASTLSSSPSFFYFRSSI
jgi:hypothetical protein